MQTHLQLSVTVLLSLVLSVATLIYFDEGTLLLATLLLAIIAIKVKKRTVSLSVLAGLGFALSIAPATGVNINEITHIENGFFIQIISSVLFFVTFYISKISIIGRISKNGAIGIVASSMISGAAGGISSALVWQAYITLFT